MLIDKKFKLLIKKFMLIYIYILLVKNYRCELLILFFINASTLFIFLSNL